MALERTLNVAGNDQEVQAGEPIFLLLADCHHLRKLFDGLALAYRQIAEAGYSDRAYVKAFAYRDSVCDQVVDLVGRIRHACTALGLRCFLPHQRARMFVGLIGAAAAVVGPDPDSAPKPRTIDETADELSRALWRGNQALDLVFREVLALQSERRAALELGQIRVPQANVPCATGSNVTEGEVNYDNHPVFAEYNYSDLQRKILKVLLKAIDKGHSVQEEELQAAIGLKVDRLRLDKRFKNCPKVRPFLVTKLGHHHWHEDGCRICPR